MYVEPETEHSDSSDSNWSFLTSDREKIEREEVVRSKSTHVQYNETTEIPRFAIFGGLEQCNEAINKYGAMRRVSIDFMSTSALGPSK